jgi:simple sugar transport system ATP-binding protein
VSRATLGGERREAGIAHVPEDRQSEGLILDFAAWENAALGYHHRDAYANGPFIDRAAIRRDCERKMARFDVRPPNPHLAAKSFSAATSRRSWWRARSSPTPTSS